MKFLERYKVHLIAVAVVAVFLAFCLLARHSPGKARPRTLLFLDESLSMGRPVEDSGRTVQQLGLAFGNELVDSVLPPRSPMQVWAFASRLSVRSIWQGAPAGAEDLLGLQEWVRNNPRKGEGTYACPAFRTALDQARQAKGTDLLVVFSSDGEWDDIDQIAPVARQLAGCKNVRGVVVAPVSVQGDYRSRLEAALQPLGGRVVIANKTDLDQAVERVRRLIGR